MHFESQKQLINIWDTPDISSIIEVILYTKSSLLQSDQNKTNRKFIYSF